MQLRPTCLADALPLPPALAQLVLEFSRPLYTDPGQILAARIVDAEYGYCRLHLWKLDGRMEIARVRINREIDAL